jgi:hypothetical protein
MENIERLERNVGFGVEPYLRHEPVGASFVVDSFSPIALYSEIGHLRLESSYQGLPYGLVGPCSFGPGEERR